MIDYFSTMASQIGISAWLIVVIVVWESIWTALAMWKSARMGHTFWFIIFFLVNLLGVPEIIYLVVTSKKKKVARSKKKRR